MNEKLANFLIQTGKVVTPYIVTAGVYDKMFNHRIMADQNLVFRLEDFTALTSKRYTFKSGRNELVGYLYLKKDVKPKALVSFSHGYGGGGHKTYLDLINAMCEYGLAVFGYDATANDESQGKGFRSFTQGVIDANNAINFIHGQKEYKKLPLIIAGHSWGAYSASNVLRYHKDAIGLVAFSGFNSATTIFKANGERYAGKEADKFMSYVDNFEEIVSGQYAKLTAIDSFKKSKAKIVIVHSQDDGTVPIEAGFNLYKKEFKDNPRFEFVKLKDRGHGTVYYTAKGKEYYDSFVASYRKFKKGHKEDEVKQFVEANLNRLVWSDLVDQKLIDNIFDFILH